jgi:hypothetical protein
LNQPKHEKPNRKAKTDQDAKISHRPSLTQHQNKKNCIGGGGKNFRKFWAGTLVNFSAGYPQFLARATMWINDTLQNDTLK